MIENLRKITVYGFNEYKIRTSSIIDSYVYHNNSHRVLLTSKDDLLTELDDNIYGKSFYLHSSSRLNKTRLDILKDNLNIKRKLKLEKADYVVIDPSIFNIRIKKSRLFKSDVFFDRLSELIKKFPDDSVQRIKKFIDFYKHDDTISLTYDIDNSDNPFKKAVYEIINEISIPCITSRNKKALEFWSFYNDNPDLTYIADTNMFEISDQFQPILDETSYKTLSQMLSNTTDFDLGIKLLNNCNFNKSLSVIGYLFYEYNLHDKIAINTDNNVLKSRLNYYFGNIYNQHKMNIIVNLLKVLIKNNFNDFIIEKISNSIKTIILHRYLSGDEEIMDLVFKN